MKAKHLGKDCFYLKYKGLHFLVKTYPFQIYNFDDKKELFITANKLVKKFSLPKKTTDYSGYFSLEFIFSTACNLACTYCFAREKKTGCYGLKPENIGKKTVSKAIDFSLRQFVKNLEVHERKTGLFDLYFMGGEPLLNKNNLFFAVEYINKKIEQIGKTKKINITLQSSISTNGTLIDNEVATFFKRNNFDYVGITIDGEKHDFYRKYSNGKGTLKDILKGIKALKRNKVRLKLLAIIPPGEVKNLDKIIDFYKSLKTFSYACRISIVPRAPAINEMHRVCAVPQKFISKIFNEGKMIDFTKKEREIFAKKIIELAEKYNLDERDIKRKTLELIRMGGLVYHCPAAVWKISVTPDGSIYPCHQLTNIKKFYMGNVLNTERQNSKYLEKIKKLFLKRDTFKVDKCRGCLYQTICPPLVDCPARSFLEKGSLFKTPQYCELYKPYIAKVFEEFINNLKS